jgi:hypothetical protein
VEAIVRLTTVQHPGPLRSICSQFTSLDLNHLAGCFGVLLAPTAGSLNPRSCRRLGG